MSRPTVASINLDALHRNLSQLIQVAGKSRIVAVVKANAYGNGAVKVAHSIEARVDILAVAFLSEAVELRQSGIVKPILILQGPHEQSDFQAVTHEHLIWILHSEWQLHAFSQFLKVTPATTHRAWLKFDSGMHRLGLKIQEFQAIISDFRDIITSDTVIVTHLSNADDSDQSHAKSQIDRFLSQVEASSLPISIANSATSVRFAKARQDYVRLGIAMYGSTPFESQDNPLSLESVMSLNSSIIALRRIPKGDCVGYGATWRAARESVIATVALGYADGYPRHSPTGTPAWCNGSLIKLVGRVSMDMLTFDVTDLKSVNIGDRVQLWGDKLPINDVADYVDTIGYELMTRVSYRVPRDYLGN